MPRNLTPFLGLRVSVTVDRPLGSRHPRHPDIIYPINYGYIPGTVSGDGMPVDAYILGLTWPVVEAQGVVVAVIVRADDLEDKLVVSQSGTHHSAERVMEEVEFQERFFKSSVIMMEPKPIA